MPENKNNFQQYVEKNLNEQQLLATQDHNGIFLVVAGAGSGKTRVITSRIANLIINKNINPNEIVALTFTNKAATEMKERIKSFLTPGTPMPFLGTFHSYCLKLLKTNRDKLEKPFESILDQDDQIKILTGIITRNNLNKRITAKKLSYNISQIKNKMTGNKDEVQELFASDRLVFEMYNAYEYEKTISKCLDFDDLLIETVKLLNKNTQFKQQLQNHVRHILVDEYQDTNVVQHVLLKHLTLNKENKFNADSLCVVGDEDQSIYSWRGATISNIINFKRDFPETKIIKLEQNYRSVQPILDAANKVIQNNQKRNHKSLWSDRVGKDRIKTIQCSSEYQEGDVISQFLQLASKKQKLSTVAILYRAHYQSRAIEEALIRSCIPYKIIGGIQFYERKEIKDILAYLKLVLNPFDRASFFRIINCPTRGLGQKFEEQFYNLWNQNIFSGFKEIAQKISSENALTGIKKDSIENFLKIFENLDENTTPANAIETIISRSNYKQYLQDSCEKTEYESRLDNIKELVRAIEFMEKSGSVTITQLLDEIALMQASSLLIEDEQDESKKDPVTLMTLHAAKGLEFDTIIIIGIEEGILPSSRSLFEDDAIEEERRLFYVGITRAKERLLLTHAEYRYSFGQTSYQPPSRFLREIPENLKNEEDFTRSSYTKIDSTFCSWLGVKPKYETYESGDLFTFGSSSRPNHDYTKPTDKLLHDYDGHATPSQTKPSSSARYISGAKMSSTTKNYTGQAGYNNNKKVFKKSNFVTGVPSRAKTNHSDTENIKIKYLDEKESDTVSQIKNNWRKNQPVSHAVFGIGVVQDVEIKGESKIYITAKFKTGTKKLDSEFLTKI
jgi:DNA helicase-2/ATP-dependent DNA helicase PcrA